MKKGRGIECEEQYFLPGATAQNHHGQMILKDGRFDERYRGSDHNPQWARIRVL